MACSFSARCNRAFERDHAEQFLEAFNALLSGMFAEKTEKSSEFRNSLGCQGLQHPVEKDTWAFSHKVVSGKKVRERLHELVLCVSASAMQSIKNVRSKG